MEENGWLDMLRVYSELERRGVNVVVIDADILAANPKVTLSILQALLEIRILWSS